MWGGIGRSRERGNCTKNILCEKIILKKYCKIHSLTAGKIQIISNVPLALDSYSILSYTFKLWKYCKQQKRRLEPGDRDKRKK